MMAGVDDYDPTRPNENPWVDDNLDNDDDDEQQQHPCHRRIPLVHPLNTIPLTLLGVLKQD